MSRQEQAPTQADPCPTHARPNTRPSPTQPDPARPSPTQPMPDPGLHILQAFPSFFAQVTRARHRFTETTWKSGSSPEIDLVRRIWKNMIFKDTVLAGNNRS